MKKGIRERERGVGGDGVCDCSFGEPLKQELCGYIGKISFAKSRLLFNRTSSIYMKVGLKALASVFFCLCINSPS